MWGLEGRCRLSFDSEMGTMGEFSAEEYEVI